MKILIDINHPAHVHYFRNMIKIMQKRGHDFKIISRNKEIEHKLLDNYDISFENRGKGGVGVFSKVIYYCKAVMIIYNYIKIYSPDIVISFGTPYPALAAQIAGIPHISIYDTEHAKLQQMMTVPFSEVVLNPSCFKKDLGKKQISFDGYMELCYLQKSYFKPDRKILEELSLDPDEKFIILRFVAWNASHDVGHKGISIENKFKAVKQFSKYAKVYISSESALPSELREYELDIPVEKIHDILYYADLFYGESATMASEAAILGTPSIYINNNILGYTQEESKYGLVYNFTESFSDQRKSIEKGMDILKRKSSKYNWQERRKQLISEKIDVTKFLIWFFENYPKSYYTLKNNPDYQYRFK